MARVSIPSSARNTQRGSPREPSPSLSPRTPTSIKPLTFPTPHAPYHSISLPFFVFFFFFCSIPWIEQKKKSYLNGAYYGPPVPPRDTYRSVGRSSSFCCCGPCCLLCNLVKFIVSIVITLGIVFLVLWLIFRPNDIKAHVDDASLTQFNYTTGTGSLSYNLSLAMSIRNPNKRISIYYDYLEARASYDGFRFGYAPLPVFYQRRKSTAALAPAFQGAQVVTEDGVAETYVRETGEGFYYVDVRVYAKLRLKVWVFKIRYNRPRIDCSLKLPVPGTAGSFEKTKCHVHHF